MRKKETVSTKDRWNGKTLYKLIGGGPNFYKLMLDAGTNKDAARDIAHEINEHLAQAAMRAHSFGVAIKKSHEKKLKRALEINRRTNETIEDLLSSVMFND